jgi:hypothetical protein
MAKIKFVVEVEVEENEITHNDIDHALNIIDTQLNDYGLFEDKAIRNHLTIAVESGSKVVVVDRDALDKVVSYVNDTESSDFDDQINEGQMEAVADHVIIYNLHLEEALNGVAELNGVSYSFKGTAVAAKHLALIDTIQNISDAVEVESDGTGTVTHDFNGYVHGIKNDTDGTVLVTVEDLDDNSFDVTPEQISF